MGTFSPTSHCPLGGGEWCWRLNQSQIAGYLINHALLWHSASSEFVYLGQLITVSYIFVILYIKKNLPSSLSSVQSLSRVQLFATPWTAALQASLSHHQLPESTQIHVHWVSDAIQPSHPLSSPSPPAFKLSQHQGLFQWASSLHQVAKVLEFQLLHQSFQWMFRTDFL